MQTQTKTQARRNTEIDRTSGTVTCTSTNTNIDTHTDIDIYTRKREYVNDLKRYYKPIYILDLVDKTLSFRMVSPFYLISMESNNLIMKKI